MLKNGIFATFAIKWGFFDDFPRKNKRLFAVKCKNDTKMENKSIKIETAIK